MKNSLFYLGFSLLFMSCVKKSEKQIYILPQGYIGKVILFFDQADGKAKEYEGDFRVYKVNPNGILKTAFPPNDGELKDPDKNCMFYYIDSAGKRFQLAVRWAENEKIKVDSIQVHSYIRGTYGDDLEYESFEIGQYNRRGKKTENSIEEDNAWRKLLKENSVH